MAAPDAGDVLPGAEREAVRDITGEDVPGTYGSRGGPPCWTTLRAHSG
jgi:hypothetical protein